MATRTSQGPPKKGYDHLFKLLLIGDSGVGKTCILLRYSDDSFSTDYISTVGVDFRIKTIQLNGKKIKLQIWDTAGQEKYDTMTATFYRGAAGILLVYDITNSKSFDNIAKWLVNIDTHATPDVQKMLLGNRCDLDRRRMVVTEDGQRLAESLSIAFMETSVESNINISEAFLAMVQNILQKNPNMQQSDVLRPTASDQEKTSSSDGEKRKKCCKSS